jgi:hypothetical protein
VAVKLKFKVPAQDSHIPFYQPIVISAGSISLYVDRDSSQITSCRLPPKLVFYKEQASRPPFVLSDFLDCHTRMLRLK